MPAADSLYANKHIFRYLYEPGDSLYANEHTYRYMYMYLCKQGEVNMQMNTFIVFMSAKSALRFAYRDVL